MKTKQCYEHHTKCLTNVCSILLNKISRKMTGKRYAELEDDGILQDSIMGLYSMEVTK